MQGGRSGDFPFLSAKQAHVSPARISPKCKPQRKLPERDGEQRKFQEPAKVGACWDNIFKFSLLESTKSNSTKRDFIRMMIWKRPLTVRTMSVWFGLQRVLILWPPCTWSSCFIQPAIKARVWLPGQVRGMSGREFATADRSHWPIKACWYQISWFPNDALMNSAISLPWLWDIAKYNFGLWRMCLSPGMQIAGKMKTHHGNFPRHSSGQTEKCAHLLVVSIAPSWLDSSCSVKLNHCTLALPQMQANCCLR